MNYEIRQHYIESELGKRFEWIEMLLWWVGAVEACFAVWTIAWLSILQFHLLWQHSIVAYDGTIPSWLRFYYSNKTLISILNAVLGVISWFAIRQTNHELRRYIASDREKVKAELRELAYKFFPEV